MRSRRQIPSSYSPQDPPGQQDIYSGQGYYAYGGEQPDIYSGQDYDAYGGEQPTTGSSETGSEAYDGHETYDRPEAEHGPYCYQPGEPHAMEVEPYQSRRSFNSSRGRASSRLAVETTGNRRTVSMPTNHETCEAALVGGLISGKRKGFQEGEKAGREEGREAGRREGQLDGYNQGFGEAMNQIEEAREESYQAGLAAGRGEGYDSGYQAATKEGGGCCVIL
ncbi:hypothetical protein F4780DRAFT_83090 [Xylariomycetidae sp. FL0641]|nr:hypothetical protein F4780DRAFT_83090 [Xylariomycetidae sp. FL0641]